MRLKRDPEYLGWLLSGMGALIASGYYAWQGNIAATVFWACWHLSMRAEIPAAYR